MRFFILLQVFFALTVSVYGQKFGTPGDKTLTCKDCGSQFEFTEREQALYIEKGFSSFPTICENCRIAKDANKRGVRNRLISVELINFKSQVSSKDAQAKFYGGLDCNLDNNKFQALWKFDKTAPYMVGKKSDNKNSIVTNYTLNNKLSPMVSITSRGIFQIDGSNVKEFNIKPVDLNKRRVDIKYEDLDRGPQLIVLRFTNDQFKDEYVELSIRVSLQTGRGSGWGSN